MSSRHISLRVGRSPAFRRPLRGRLPAGAPCSDLPAEGGQIRATTSHSGSFAATISSPTMKTVRIQADFRKLLILDATAFVFGAAAVFLISRIPLLISTPVLLMLILALAAALAADVCIWILLGVRSISVSGKSVTFEKGRRSEAVRIWASDIRRIRSRRFLGKKIVITIGAPPRWKLIPFMGKLRRLRISESAFQREDFDRLLSALSSLDARRTSA